MQKYFNYWLDNRGEPIRSGTVQVNTSAGAAATLYDEDGATITNPLTTDTDGYFEFYAPNGRYTLSLSKSGYSTTTIPNVLLDDPTVATIAALRAAGTPTTSNARVKVLGHTTVGDGGGGDFYWDSTSSDADDNGITILPTGYAGTGRLKRSYTGAVRPEWFGATGDGTDQTTALQAWLTHDSYAKEVGMGHFKYTSLNITKPTLIRGLSSKHIYKRGVTGVTISDLTDATIFEGTSTTTPGLNCATATTGDSGLHIEGLVFYQTHADYSAPTDYPYCISDENSTAWWSGVTIRDCMFVNANKGINFTKAERTDITDINADFFRRGINIGTSNDCSVMERIHIWNFAQSTLASAFRQTTSSDYAIYIDDSDGHTLNDIFIWDRLYGVYVKKLWGTISNYTADVVGVPLVIADPIPIATHVSNLQLSANNPVADQRAAILITHSTTANAAGSVTINGVSAWQGVTHAYGYDSVVEVDGAGLNVDLRNIVPKYFGKQVVKITSADNVTVDGLRCQNSVPNQTATALTTVGIRNESTGAKVVLKNISADELRHVFDGYCENVVFDEAPSLIQLKPTVNWSSATMTGPGTYAAGEGYKTALSDTDSAGTFAGARDISPKALDASFESGKNYIFGVEYKVTSALTGPAGDTRFYAHYDEGVNDFYALFDTSVHTARRMVAVKYTPSASAALTTGGYARTFSGTMEIFNTFIAKNDNLVCAKANPPNLAVSAAPTATSAYALAGEQLNDSAPAAGATRFICTVAGAPGTWIND